MCSMVCERRMAIAVPRPSCTLAASNARIWAPEGVGRAIGYGSVAPVPEPVGWILQVVRNARVFGCLGGYSGVSLTARELPSSPDSGRETPAEFQADATPPRRERLRE